MTRSLFNAVLALDSYNRGYEAAVQIDSTILGIGNATTILDSGVLLNNGVRQDVNAGFYAIAYQFGSEKIISYRGTDRNISLPWSGAPGSDFLNGYGLALGSPYGLQAGLAVEFYKAVAEGADPFAANISTTGHSLGGGLAANDNFLERLAT